MVDRRQQTLRRQFGSDIDARTGAARRHRRSKIVALGDGLGGKRADTVDADNERSASSVAAITDRVPSSARCCNRRKLIDLSVAVRRCCSAGLVFS
jgi:hypothetical protein